MCIVYIQGKWLANYTTVSWYTEWQMTNTVMYQLIGSSNNERVQTVKMGSRDLAL